MPDLEQFDWTKMQGGYRVPYDPRPAISVLESNPDQQEAWQLLWENLHHQGDVGEASYAAVPLIFRALRSRLILDCNAYAIPAVIELRRRRAGNPTLPETLREEYLDALHGLARLGAHQITSEIDPDTSRAILAILALDKGLHTHAHFLLDYSEDELHEIDPERAD